MASEVFRQKVIDEIISSEESYVRHMRLIKQFFMEPLRATGILPGYVIAQIFGNLPQLIGIKELLMSLKEQSVGESFLSLTPYLKLYSAYANNHELALKALLEWQQTSCQFAEFRRAQEDVEEVGGLKLNALLITPVQRIPRYKLLLQELVKQTDEADAEYERLTRCVQQITAIAEYINSHIAAYDNTQRMVEIQKRLTGEKLNIIEPGREFIKEGLLKKVSASGKRTYKRMFFLFSDMLMYSKVDAAGHYSACCSLPLNKCSVSTVLFHSKNESQQQAKGGLFKVSCMETELLLCSDSRKTIDDWISALDKAISVYRKNRTSLRKESSGKRPMRVRQMVKEQRQRRTPLATINPRSRPKDTKKKALETILSCHPILKRNRRRSLL